MTDTMTTPKPDFKLSSLSDAQQAGLVRILDKHETAKANGNGFEPWITVGGAFRDDIHKTTLTKLIGHGLVTAPGFDPSSRYHISGLLVEFTPLGLQVATYLYEQMWGLTPKARVERDRKAQRDHEREQKALAREVKRLARTSTLPKKLRDNLRGTVVDHRGRNRRLSTTIYPEDALEILRATQKGDADA